MSKDEKLKEIAEIIKHVEDGDITAPNDKALSEYICELINEVIAGIL